MMPATIARAASAGEAFSSVSTSPIRVSIGPGYTPNTCVFCARSIARVTCVSECVAAFEALYAARIGKLTNDATELRLAMAPAILREDWRERLRHGERAEEVHFHLPSPALDPLRVGEIPA